ncbi:MAG: right-handed parallel beta-helix repeat-containing protein [Ignavibacteria bacterium]|nr:right-handed parallel beta-helix repeat-containing protein [Ignavibacteria bacterium]
MTRNGSFFTATTVALLLAIASPGTAQQRAIPSSLPEVTTRHDTRSAPSSAAARTFVVTDPGDVGDANPGDTLCYPCTFRAAIENAGRTPERDLIVFSPLVPVVTLFSALPEINTPLLIDGWLDSAHNVALDGAQASNATGLRLSGGGSAVRNLEIRGFIFGGVALAGRDSSAVQGCFIHDNGAAGVTVSSKYHLVGASALGYPNTIVSNNGAGIALAAGADYTAIVANRIGTVDGVTAAPNSGSGVLIASSRNLVSVNLISGNTRHGLEIVGDLPLPEENTISSNFIGTAASAMSALPNREDGVHVAAGSADTIAYNVISGNTGTGIAFGAETGLSGTRLWIAGNYIGTNLRGNAALANLAGIDGRGSTIEISGNLISGNTGSGIGVTGTSWTIRANRIGCDSSGATALPNGGGITVSSYSTSTTDSIFIGGNAAADGNLISGNDGSGVLIQGEGTSKVTVSRNNIGLAATGSSALPNNGSGVWITDGAHDVGVQFNLISGNAQSGVSIDGGTIHAPHDNIVRGNRIGTDVTGTVALMNQTGGIAINKSPSNLIGGTESGDGNLISGNASYGISIFGKESAYNFIQGNLIGTDAGGSRALLNGDNITATGITVASARDLVIGGASPAEGNIIVGSTCIAFRGADSNLISGNRLGGIGSGGGYYGVYLVSSNDNIINGNIVIRNSISGIRLASSRNNAISANLVSVTETGILDKGPDYAALELVNSAGNVIGGSLAWEGNTLGGSRQFGIALNKSDSNLVAGNFIGTDAAGIARFGNGTSGILVSNSLGNVIGGEGIANRIAFNKKSGIGIDGAGTTDISANAIYENGFGIDLNTAAFPVTSNDTLDTDSGPNSLQNYPTLSDASAGHQTRVKGVLNSAAGGAYTLQFFASPSCDSSGYGQGRRYLGAAACATDAKGIASFAVTLPSPSADGEAITATAIDALGNTSEFSRCAVAVPPLRTTDMSLLVTALRDTISVGDTLTYMLNAVNHGPGEATGVLIRDTIPSLLSYVSSTASHGSITLAGGVLECAIPSLQKDEVASVAVRARAMAPDLLRLRAAVFAIENDSLPANNTGTRTVVIRVPTGFDSAPNIAGGFSIGQNYPNPFTQQTAISFTLERAAHVTLKVYNIFGGLVATLADGTLEGGRHTAHWHPRSLPRGVYTCVLTGGGSMRTMRMIAD